MAPQALDGDNRRRLFDKLCILLIIFITLVSVVRWSSLYPDFIDSYYHMAVIRAFSDSGGVVFHDYWEYAPAGRPHVYAPLVHIIGYLLHSIGLSIYTVGQIISWWPYPVSFLAVWLWLRNVTGPRSAFFAIALLLGPSAWFMNQTAFTANSVALVLAPLTFLAFSKEKYVTAAVLATLACYSHGSGLVVPAALLLYGIHRPRLLLKRVLPVVGAALLAFLPWAIHVYSNRNLMSLARMGGDTLMQLGNFQIFLLLMPLALVGLMFAYLRRGKALMLPSFLFAFAVMIPMGYAHRFWRFKQLSSIRRARRLRYQQHHRMARKEIRVEAARNRFRCRSHHHIPYSRSGYRIRSGSGTRRTGEWCAKTRRTRRRNGAKVFDHLPARSSAANARNRQTHRNESDAERGRR